MLQRPSDPALAPTLPASAAPHDALIGRELIGQYTVKKRLADGGMGAVYLAEQTAVARPAVIKILSPRIARVGEHAARFDLEARAVSQLNHPNIVTIYNYGALKDGTRFIAMEYLEGRSLKELIEADAPIGLPRAAAIARQIAAALSEAHRHRVVHRDLKPSNVMIVTRGGDPEFVKVLDFGIAKMEGVELTVSGQLFGTPAYMSPEQFRARDLDGRSDLYSLAIVLYEMLTGDTPFSADTPVGYMGKHLAAPPPPLRAAESCEHAPEALEALLVRALAKDPDGRPPSIDAFIAELNAALEPPTTTAIAPIAAAHPPAASSPPAASAGVVVALGLRLRELLRQLWSRTRAWARPRPKSRWFRAKRTVAGWLDRLPWRRKRTVRQRLRAWLESLRRS